MTSKESNGKSRPAVSPQGGASDPRPDSSASVAARIRASASGLVRDSILRPGPSSVADTLASVNADAASKGGSGSSSAGLSLSSMTSGTDSSSAQSLPPLPARSVKFDSFHSQPKIGSSTHGTFDFDTFFNGRNFPSPDRFQPLLIEDATRYSSPSSHSTLHYEQTWSGPGRHVAGTLPDGNTDGAAVVTLLANPHLNPDEDPTNFLYSDWEEPTDAQLRTPPVVLQEAASVDTLSSFKPLALLPDFRVPEGTAIESSDGDLQPWFEILNKYHDEVWGDMLPLVQEARREVEAAKKGSSQARPAIRRLKMLLRHVER